MHAHGHILITTPTDTPVPAAEVLIDLKGKPYRWYHSNMHLLIHPFLLSLQSPLLHDDDSSR